MSATDERSGATVVGPSAPGQGSLIGRVRAGVMAAVGAVSGVAPHVLHHVGPIAGAALLTGAGGTALFFVLGLLVSIPLLLRLHRRFQTWAAPAVAVAVFTAAFAISTLVIGPALRGDSSTSTPIEAPGGHSSHH